MRYKAFSLLIVLFTVISSNTMSQTLYEKKWDNINALIEKRLWTQAFKSSNEVQTLAEKENNSTALLISTKYKIDAINGYQEEPIEKSIAEYESILPKLKGVDTNICHAILAKIYTMLNTRLESEAQDKEHKIQTHRQYAISQREALKATPIKNYIRLCEKDGLQTNNKGKVNIVLTPTVYDILIHNEIELNNNSEIQKKLYKELLQFHSKDDERIRIYLETAIVHQEEMESNAKSSVWENLIAKYSSSRCDEACQLYANYASALYEEHAYEKAVEICKKAITKFDKCEGRADCENLLNLIYKKSITIAGNASRITSCNTSNMIGIETKNIDTLYCWIAKLNNNSEEKKIEEIQEKNIVAKWSQEIPRHGLNEETKSYCYLPGLPSGHYLLILSNNAKEYRKQYTGWEFYCSNAQIITANCNQQDLRKGYLIDRHSGKPIAGIQLTLQEKSRNRGGDMQQKTTTTDKEGYYYFEGHNGVNETLTFSYEGIEIAINGYVNENREESEQQNIEIVTDRPVYRLGDTIKATAIVYQGYTNQPKLIIDKTLYAELRNVNRQIVTKGTATTDNYGRATFTLTTPKESLPGNYSLTISDHANNSGSRGIMIEEYKQPKFTISLQTQTEENKIGDSVIISGTAISYTETAISNAKVLYEIKRIDYPWTWRKNNGTTIATGETTSDDKGMFTFEFVAQAPDKPISKDYHYIYQITASVTDITGETHEAEHNVSIALQSIAINIENEEQCNTLDEIRYSYTNSDGKAIKGIAEITIRPINTASSPKLAHPNENANTQHTISKKEFEKRFPLFAYTTARDTGKVVFHTYNTTSSDQKNKVAIPPLTDGVYVVEINGKTKDDKVVKSQKTITVVGKQSKKLKNEELLWTDIDKREYNVGEMLTIRIGSRYDDVTVYYSINKQNEIVKYGTMPLSNEIKELTIPITEQLKGGFDINIITEKCCVAKRIHHYVTVPYTEKKLSIEYTTFRDRLTPGERETWKITIRNAQGEKSDAAMIMTMYDAALETYNQLNWHLWPWRDNSSTGNLWTREMDKINNIYSWQWGRWETKKYVSYPSNTNYTYYTLQTPVLYSLSYGRQLYSAKSMPLMANAMVEADAAVATGAREETAAIQSEKGQTEQDNEPKIRKNLESIGFYYPSLISEKDGSITIQFTVPELLTRWTIHSIAYNKELSVGEDITSAITQKPITVEPLVPRFVREGDEIDIKAKVSNNQTKAEKVTITLAIEDASNKTQWDDNKPITITLPAESHEVVCFHIKVPQQGTAAKYTIIAKGEHSSDGEQNIIPVLSNRELVTESRAMYVNGKGVKTYTLPNLRKGSREPKLLSIEYTSNPIWHAITSLPYLKQKENPSNIYLCNSLYTNVLTQEIIDSNPTIITVIQKEKDKEHSSRLRQNKDIKQTIIENTPYLHKAEYEEEKWDKISEHFDKERMNKEIAECTQKIIKNQRDDGSWSWIAGDDHSSEYATRYILRLLGNSTYKENSELKKSIIKAIRYLDDCAKKEYAKYKKEDIKTATDEDYLFIHSLYGNKYLNSDAKEAYQYYMRNSEKEYLEKYGIERQAKMALILHRNGKNDKARKILEQIEESSLYDEEMGRYWRENVKSHCWSKDAIETQASLICAFTEIAPEKREIISQMQQWLLKQKQTTIWSSDIATIEAIRALIYNNSSTLPIEENADNSSITYNHTTIPCDNAEGYAQKRWNGDSIPDGKQAIKIEQNINSIGWGAAYWQYEEEIDKIENSSTGLKLTKEILHRNDAGEWEKIDGKKIKTGERIKVQIKIESDRNLEYVELIENRAGGTEPATSRSGWTWGKGLSYYVAVKDNDTRYYIERLNKGKYLIEYELYATHSGKFDSGTTKIQGLYSPEFRATAHSEKVEIE